MTLPYENATSGKNALQEIQSVLKAFGCQKMGVMEDFQTGDLLVQFTHRDRDVVVRASPAGYASAWLRHNPWTTQKRASREQWEKRALEQGKIAVYSIVRDWIKGQVTAIECGIMPFEEAFLGQLQLPDGSSVMQRVRETGVLAIEDKRNG